MAYRCTVHLSSSICRVMFLPFALNIQHQDNRIHNLIGATTLYGE
jgi:hypothetical protein